MSKKITIELLSEWAGHKVLDVIEEDYGVAKALIEYGRARLYIQPKKMGRPPKNKKLKVVENKTYGSD